jgi:hypothetical protein
MNNYVASSSAEAAEEEAEEGSWAFARGAGSAEEDGAWWARI